MRTWPALEVSRLKPAPTIDELFQAALLDFNVAAIDETAADSWRVFFTTAADRDAARAELAPQFPDLSFQLLDIPDEDWAARSQASLRAIQIGNIVVAPPWDVPPPVGATPATDNLRARFSRLITIIIQPSMGFGTGHHATTRLCLAALQQLDLRGRRVLDVGTGSGVLAIAASLLGAADVVAIDDDPDAIQSARENVALTPGARVAVDVADLRAGRSEPSDVVIANLTGGLLIQTAARLRDLVTPAGQLVLSGFLIHEETDVRAAYSGLQVSTRGAEDEWVCITLAR